MLSLWRRAAQNLPLSPEERAILKFVKSTIVSAFISAVVAVYPFIAGAKNANVDWGTVEHTFFITMLMVIYATSDKYVTAHLIHHRSLRVTQRSFRISVDIDSHRIKRRERYTVNGNVSASARRHSSGD